MLGNEMRKVRYFAIVFID